ncbi:uncharacterized protein LOC131687998 [Topomyia yanbarensis]|uniref:uncharacterized protein LOC131687998 n=1 Tax=Topomyia yanbarensis TaxID=2498891 RepID=UPI00273AAD00|nr:uncharacterized protein LOC131687998 [Topomyia yanbarensis]
MSKGEKIVVERVIQRKGCYVTCELVEKFINEYLDDRDQVQISVRIDVLDRTYQNFLEAQAEIEKNEKQESLDARFMERIDFEERYCVAKGFLLSKRSVDAHELALNSSANSNTVPPATNHHLRLPKIDLPKFNGDFSRWMTYRDTFQSMIHVNAEIPAVVKLQYLLQSLEGEAKKPFESTDVIADNYGIAWETLLRRYDNRRLLKRQLFRALYDLPSFHSESAQDLHTLADDFHRHVKALAKLGEPVNQWDTPLTSILSYKLDSTTLQCFEEKMCNKEKVTYEELVEFLYQRVRILESVALDMHHRIQSCSTGAGKLQISKMASNAAVSIQPALVSGQDTQNNDVGCVVCSERHSIYQCSAFYQMPVAQRCELVSTRRLCWNCLSPGHISRRCNSKFSCRHCNERHHSLLHTSDTDLVASVEGSSEIHPQPSTSSGLSSVDPRRNGCIFLETVTLHVVDHFGKVHIARALLDSGSTSNFMSYSLADRLGPSSPIEIAVAGVGHVININRQLTATIKAVSLPFSTTLNFMLVAQPSLKLPSVPVDVAAWKIPEVTLADPQFHTPGGIDLIIGGELYQSLHTGRRLSLGDGLPMLVETLLGWTVSGGMNNAVAENNPVCLVSATNTSMQISLQEYDTIANTDTARTVVPLFVPLCSTTTAYVPPLSCHPHTVRSKVKEYRIPHSVLCNHEMLFNRPHRENVITYYSPMESPPSRRYNNFSESTLQHPM